MSGVTAEATVKIEADEDDDDDDLEGFDLDQEINSYLENLENLPVEELMAEDLKTEQHPASTNSVLNDETVKAISDLTKGLLKSYQAQYALNSETVTKETNDRGDKIVKSETIVKSEPVSSDTSKSKYKSHEKESDPLDNNVNTCRSSPVKCKDGHGRAIGVTGDSAELLSVKREGNNQISLSNKNTVGSLDEGSVKLASCSDSDICILEEIITVNTVLKQKDETKLASDLVSPIEDRLEHEDLEDAASCISEQETVILPLRKGQSTELLMREDQKLVEENDKKSECSTPLRDEVDSAWEGISVLSDYLDIYSNISEDNSFPDFQNDETLPLKSPTKETCLENKEIQCSLEDYSADANLPRTCSIRKKRSDQSVMKRSKKKKRVKTKRSPSLSHSPEELSLQGRHLKSKKSKVSKNSNNYLWTKSLWRTPSLSSISSTTEDMCPSKKPRLTKKMKKRLLSAANIPISRRSSSPKSEERFVTIRGGKSASRSPSGSCSPTMEENVLKSHPTQKSKNWVISSAKISTTRRSTSQTSSTSQQKISTNRSKTQWRDKSQSVSPDRRKIPYSNRKKHFSFNKPVPYYRNKSRSISPRRRGMRRSRSPRVYRRSRSRSGSLSPYRRRQSRSRSPRRGKKRYSRSRSPFRSRSRSRSPSRKKKYKSYHAAAMSELEQWRKQAVQTILGKSVVSATETSPVAVVAVSKPDETKAIPMPVTTDAPVACTSEGHAPVTVPSAAPIRVMGKRISIEYQHYQETYHPPPFNQEQYPYSSYTAVQQTYYQQPSYLQKPPPYYQLPCPNQPQVPGMEVPLPLPQHFPAYEQPYQQDYQDSYQYASPQISFPLPPFQYNVPPPSVPSLAPPPAIPVAPIYPPLPPDLPPLPNHPPDLPPLPPQPPPCITPPPLPLEKDATDNKIEISETSVYVAEKARKSSPSIGRQNTNLKYLLPALPKLDADNSKSSGASSLKSSPIKTLPSCNVSSVSVESLSTSKLEKSEGSPKTLHGTPELNHETGCTKSSRLENLVTDEKKHRPLKPVMKVVPSKITTGIKFKLNLLPKPLLGHSALQLSEGEVVACEAEAPSDGTQTKYTKREQLELQGKQKKSCEQDSQNIDSSCLQLKPQNNELKIKKSRWQVADEQSAAPDKVPSSTSRVSPFEDINKSISMSLNRGQSLISHLPTTLEGKEWIVPLPFPRRCIASDWFVENKPNNKSKNVAFSFHETLNESRNTCLKSKPHLLSNFTETPVQLHDLRVSEKHKPISAKSEFNTHSKEQGITISMIKTKDGIIFSNVEDDDVQMEESTYIGPNQLVLAMQSTKLQSIQGKEEDVICIMPPQTPVEKLQVINETGSGHFGDSECVKSKSAPVEKKIEVQPMKEKAEDSTCITPPVTPSVEKLQPMNETDFRHIEDSEYKMSKSAPVAKKIELQSMKDKAEDLTCSVSPESRFAKILESTNETDSKQIGNLECTKSKRAPVADPVVEKLELKSMKDKAEDLTCTVSPESRFAKILESTNETDSRQIGDLECTESKTAPVSAPVVKKLELQSMKDKAEDSTCTVPPESRFAKILQSKNETDSRQIGDLECTKSKTDPVVENIEIQLMKEKAEDSTCIMLPKRVEELKLTNVDGKIVNSQSKAPPIVKELNVLPVKENAEDSNLVMPLETLSVEELNPTNVDREVGDSDYRKLKATPIVEEVEVLPMKEIADDLTCITPPEVLPVEELKPINETDSSQTGDSECEKQKMVPIIEKVGVKPKKKSAEDLTCIMTPETSSVRRLYMMNESNSKQIVDSECKISKTDSVLEKIEIQPMKKRAEVLTCVLPSEEPKPTNIDRQIDNSDCRKSNVTSIAEIKPVKENAEDSTCITPLETASSEKSLSKNETEPRQTGNSECKYSRMVPNLEKVEGQPIKESAGNSTCKMLHVTSSAERLQSTKKVYSSQIRESKCKKSKMSSMLRKVKVQPMTEKAEDLAHTTTSKTPSFEALKPTNETVNRQVEPEYAAQSVTGTLLHFKKEPPTEDTDTPPLPTQTNIKEQQILLSKEKVHAIKCQFKLQQLPIVNTETQEKNPEDSFIKSDIRDKLFGSSKFRAQDSSKVISQSNVMSHTFLRSPKSTEESKKQPDPLLKPSKLSNQSNNHCSEHSKPRSTTQTSNEQHNKHSKHLSRKNQLIEEPDKFSLNARVLLEKGEGMCLSKQYRKRPATPVEPILNTRELRSLARHDDKKKSKKEMKYKPKNLPSISKVCSPQPLVSCTVKAKTSTVLVYHRARPLTKRLRLEVLHMHSSLSSYTKRLIAQDIKLRLIPIVKCSIDVSRPTKDIVYPPSSSTMREKPRKDHSQVVLHPFTLTVPSTSFSHQTDCTAMNNLDQCECNPLSCYGESSSRDPGQSPLLCSKARVDKFQSYLLNIWGDWSTRIGTSHFVFQSKRNTGTELDKDRTESQGSRDVIEHSFPSTSSSSCIFSDSSHSSYETKYRTNTESPKNSTGCESQESYNSERSRDMAEHSLSSTSSVFSFADTSCVLSETKCKARTELAKEGTDCRLWWNENRDMIKHSSATSKSSSIFSFALPPKSSDSTAPSAGSTREAPVRNHLEETNHSTPSTSNVLDNSVISRQARDNFMQQFQRQFCPATRTVITQVQLSKYGLHGAVFPIVAEESRHVESMNRLMEMLFSTDSLK